MARQATVKIVYQGVDITADISRNLLQFVYNDNTGGESDEIELRLEDADGLWRNAWYPKKGDKVQASITFEGDTLECGAFTIDELEFSGPPDTVMLKAIGAGVTAAVRTKNSYAYEQQTVEEIITTVAQRNGLEAEITPPMAIPVNRVTQNRELDLGFLSRLSNEYGYKFSMRDTKITVVKRTVMHAVEIVRTITRNQIARYTFKDKTFDVFKEAKMAYHDPVTSAPITDENGDGMEDSADTLLVDLPAENEQQAELKTSAALEDKNNHSTELRVTKEGDPLLVSGINFNFTGMGELSGKYHVEKSSHKVDRGGGYNMELECYRVQNFTDDTLKVPEIA